MIVPTIHLNGTSKDELLRQLEDVARQLGETLDALQNAAPNGRDYYPQGPAAIQTAVAEHIARCQRIIDVQREVAALWEAIDEQ